LAKGKVSEHNCDTNSNNNTQNELIPLRETNTNAILYKMSTGQAKEPKNAVYPDGEAVYRRAQDQ